MRYIQTLTLVAGLLNAGAGLAAGQATQRPPAPSPGPVAPLPPAAPQQPPPQMVLEGRDAREIRQQLRNVLNQYPPSVAEVLRLDPTLMSRPEYLANYPMLAAFLQQHPEVAHNPAFFIGERQFQEQNNNPQMEVARAFRQMVDIVGTVLVVLTITGGVIFLVKTVIDHRRWQRMLKAQGELNTKLIDRFASSDELLAYLQSPQGRSLTQGPALPQPVARGMDAPLGRIFWSLQAGTVLACAGAGLLFVSGRMRDETAVLGAPLFAFSMVVLTIGVGFLASSLVSYFLSQRLGLVPPLNTRMSGEAPGQ